ncbi:MAG: excisionase [Ruminococcaceae bacterium]|nr:excisionase [Oscillospiraceae bacterium]
MKRSDLPIESRYAITIEEAAGYSLIGENRLRKIIECDQTLEWVMHVGSQVRIKRELFERWLDEQYHL